LLSISEIKQHAEGLLPASYAIADAKAYLWIRDAQYDMGSAVAVEDLYIYAATEDVKYRLPSNFLSVVIVLDSDGDEYDDYEIANGFIEFGDDDTYNMTYRRLPGPLVHKQDDTADIVTTADADDEDSLVALTNDLVTAYTTHIASTTYHLAADATNTVSATEADDEDTAITRLNELKTDLNAHRILTTSHISADSHAVQSAAATDSDSAYALANELKSRLNYHLRSGLVHEAYHRALALYCAYMKVMTEKPDSALAAILYSQYADEKLEAGLATGTYSRGTDKVKGWW
jgi:hypothetical protein